MHLAEYLRFVREAAGLTRTQLAERSGISRMTLWRWERALALPHQIELHQALLALNVTPQGRRHALILREQARPRLHRAASANNSGRKRGVRPAERE